MEPSKPACSGGCSHCKYIKVPAAGNYHVLANADVDAIDAIFVVDKDDEINPLGVKGVGEIGIVGTAAAIANAIYHAGGKRARDLPITIDKLLRD
jgi:xanthine dehydrogenase YagR molybdenum-binding subunit